MHITHPLSDAPELSQPPHTADQYIAPPYKVALIGLGVIFIIGSAIGAGLLYSHH